VKEISDLRVIFEHLPVFYVIRERGPVSNLDLVLTARMEGKFKCYRISRQRVCDSVLQSRDERELAQVETFDQVLYCISIASHSGMSSLVFSL